MAVEYYDTPASRKDKKITQKQKKKGKKDQKRNGSENNGGDRRKGESGGIEDGETGENGKQPTFWDINVINSFLFHFLILIHSVQ